jgi:hypothetical protein
MDERALVEALRLELSRAEAGSAESEAINESLRRAIMEEKVSQQIRRETAEAVAAANEVS